MGDYYLFMLIALAILAIADLVVGVSNDAVNFLNSAIGSKAISFKTIMIVASVGIAFGALSSSGMMEVARKGIFVPGEFYFNEIMVIFMAVMITDILLLDFFNTLGLPTSTTVSIVFELLGAAVCMSIIKITKSGEDLSSLSNYIASDKATTIILGILLSVAIAFTIGALVQFVTRFLLSFDFEKRPSWAAAIFGGLATTSIAYFIIVKGLKGAELLPESFNAWAQNNFYQFIGANAVVWTLVSFALTRFFKVNVYKFIIVLGTFALAMAFAGNDLVNFIGVPMAAYESYSVWGDSQVAADTFAMTSLSQAVRTEPLLLLLAGVIMVLTLWFSEKARRVVKTSVDLSRQDEVKERFKPNWLSQNLVRLAIGLNRGFTMALPEAARNSISKRFAPTVKSKILDKDAPAFDMVRAAINLVVASVLISIATGLKLPLSTTYVTFMVAMGTSLADRAWGSDSAVYRVAGVINVIAGWFMTAITAFIAAAIMAALIYYFEWFALITLLILAMILIARSYLRTSRNTKEIREELEFKMAESTSVKGVIEESANNVSTVMKRGSKILNRSLDALARQNLKDLKKARNDAESLSDEMDDLKNHIFFYIKGLDGSSAGATRFYLMVQDSLEDFVQSIGFIAKTSHKHVKNNHQGLTFNQIRDLKQIEEQLLNLFAKVKTNFDAMNLDELPNLIAEKQEFDKYISSDIEKQIQRTKQPDSSARNTTLYFSLLLECKDLVETTATVLEQYYKEWEVIKKPEIL
ncbi:inorganic phosphate transporter [Gilvibacter sediminis]|uniref:inorganic phosphate transporter n=1 Tax=Gilvibacter sediminis TaxID=379071 RepID=UPI002350717B|nr:inorganic phosphate transporter [Gilvibacter sediminis]MDC7996506.1 inorganic phosphate transporter [Gilvibacter sediminis]